MADVRRAVRDALAPLTPPAARERAVDTPCAAAEGPQLHTAERRDREHLLERAVGAPRHGSAGPELHTRGGADGENAPALVLVALSGGPDSLALAAATAFEAPRAGLRAGAVIVDHGLQSGSAEAAERAAAHARALGLAPVEIRRVEVASRPEALVPERAQRDEGPYPGPEAAARRARYAALDAARAETGATAILLGHTLDDQAET
ncbi:MAG: hypothetical protein J7480_05225, partial [Microbacteriaceae bacterium]|nr:hypothetical protein [Microbacteriaceae bacterium]